MLNKRIDWNQKSGYGNNKHWIFIVPLKKNKNIDVVGTKITVTHVNNEDYVCITDIAKYKNPEAPADIVKNWLRNKNTIDLLGLWEKLR